MKKYYRANCHITENNTLEKQINWTVLGMQMLQASLYNNVLMRMLFIPLY